MSDVFSLSSDPTLLYLTHPHCFFPLIKRRSELSSRFEICWASIKGRGPDFLESCFASFLRKTHSLIDSIKHAPVRSKQAISATMTRSDVVSRLAESLKVL